MKQSISNGKEVTLVCDLNFLEEPCIEQCHLFRNLLRLEIRQFVTPDDIQHAYTHIYQQRCDSLLHWPINPLSALYYRITNLILNLTNHNHNLSYFCIEYIKVPFPTINKSTANDVKL